MSKMKTHSGSKKRFVKLKSGLIKAAHSGRRHKLAKKSAQRKRVMRSKLYISCADRAVILQLLPY